MLEYLLAQGATIDIRDADGDTPLLVTEEPAIFDFLLAAGADVTARNSEGQGVVEKAAEDHSNALVRHLMDGGYVTDPAFTYDFDAEPDAPAGFDYAAFEMQEEGDDDDDDDEEEVVIGGDADDAAQ